MALDMNALMGTDVSGTPAGETPMQWVDADTVEQDGQRYRIQGIDAPEVVKFVDGSLKQGTAGGQAYMEAIPKLARELGFTELRVIEEEGETFGRKVADLVNPQTGESFKNAALSAGLFDATTYTTNQDNLAARLGQSQREQDALMGVPQDDAWGQAREGLLNAAAAEGLKQQGTKQLALDEAQLAMANQFGYGGHFAQSTVGTRDFGRDLDNKSNNPLSTAIDVGLEGAAQGLYGFAELVGDTAEWDWAAQKGRTGQERASNRLADMGTIVTSYKDVDGIFGKDGALQYVVNNAAISMPYMAVTMGATALAPVTGGLSISVPSALYAGQVYSEMEGDNKNAAIAVGAGIAQATLDRLGLSMLLPKGSSLVNDTVRKGIVDKLIDTGKAANAAEAKQMLASATRASMAEMSGEAVKFAQQQIKARNVARTAIANAVKGGSSEAVTEAMQEAIGYTAAHHADNFRDWDANEFADRISQAMVAGGTLGGAFGIPGTAFDAGAWADVAYRQAPSTSQNRAWAADKADQDIKTFGQQVNIQDFNNATTAQSRAAAGTVDTIDTRTKRFNASKLNRTVRQEASALWRSIPGLWRGLTRHAFDRDLNERSNTARWLGESYGSALQRSTSGATYENRKHHLVTQFKNTMRPINTIMSSFGLQGKRKQRQELSADFYTAYQRALAKAESEGRAINWDQDLEGKMLEQKDQFLALHAELNTLGDKLWQEQAKHNPELGYIPDYLSKYKSFDKAAIEQNRGAFEAALKQEFPNMSALEARELTDAVLNMDGVSDIDDALSVIQSAAAGKPSSHKKRSLGLSEKESFAPFMENDLFTNISNASKSAARYSAFQEFVGKDNEKLNSHLNQVEQELIASGLGPNEAKARVDKLAADMADYLDAESGNYNRIKNPFLAGAQKNLLFVTTILGLPLATVSNFVEIAMTARALTADQIFGKKGSLKQMGTDFGREVKTLFVHEGSKNIDQIRKEGGSAVAKDLGFFEWEVGAAHTTGVTETSHAKQRILDWYFKAIGLQTWTNATRSVRAGIAGDFVVNHIETINRNKNDSVETRETYEAKEALRNLGVDPDFMVEYWNTLEPTEAQNTRFEDFMRDAAFNFVNEAVALPQAANRPKIFQDPRFALFTQFQGFISTFTANHIPRMWNEYVARGTPAMKYNAFALMTTMIALGFASQWLKDQIKYGGDSPYIEGTDYIRRGIGASGWLGTGERVLDFVFPVYEERYYNPIDWAFGTVTGESAALGKAIRAGSIAGKVAAGEKPVSEFGKLSPLTVAAQNNIDWNFGG